MCAKSFRLGPIFLPTLQPSSTKFTMEKLLEVKQMTTRAKGQASEREGRVRERETQAVGSRSDGSPQRHTPHTPFPALLHPTFKWKRGEYSRDDIRQYTSMLKHVILRRGVSRAAARCRLSRRMLLPAGQARHLSTVDATSQETLEEYADRRQTSVNMETLLKTGYGYLLDKTHHTKDDTSGAMSTRERTLVQVASFLHREMPVRFAHRARELQRLPYGLAEMPSIQTVCRWYKESFQELASIPGACVSQGWRGSLVFSLSLSLSPLLSLPPQTRSP